jgi:O-antigen/teichoic acid export membrane protein
MFKRMTISLSGRVLGALLQLVALSQIARHLTLPQFGLFSVSLAVAFGCMAIIELGMGNRILRGPQSPEYRESFTAFFRVRVIAFVLVLIALAMMAVSQFFDFDLVMTALAYAYGDTAGDLAAGIFQGQKNSKKAAISLISRRVAVLAPLFFLQGQLAVDGAGFVIFVLGCAWFTQAALPLLTKAMPLTQLLRENATMIFGSGAGNLSQLDTPLVSAASGTINAGLYGSGTRLLNPLNILVSTFISVLIPELSSSGPSTRQRTFQRARLLIVTFAGLLMIVSPIMPHLLVFIYGEKFASAAPVAIAVTISSGFAAISQVHLAWFFSEKFPAKLTVTTIASVVCGLVLTFVLSYPFGLIGSCAGLIAGNVLVSIATWVIYEQAKK